jgi:hypothetical protein
VLFEPCLLPDREPFVGPLGGAVVAAGAALGLREVQERLAARRLVLVRSRSGDSCLEHLPRLVEPVGEL